MRDSRPQLLDVLFDDASAGSKGPLHNVQQRAVALPPGRRAGRSPHPGRARRGRLERQSQWRCARYEQPALLSALRAQILPSLSSIDIRINPALMAKGSHQVQNAEKAPEKRVPMRHLSLESAEELRGLASRSHEETRKI